MSAIEDWAKKFGGTAILGFLCTLLVGGKFLHHAFLRRGLVCGSIIIPPALISGLLGFLAFWIISVVDSQIAQDLGQGLAEIKLNLVNFVFAALTLGLTCKRSSSQHSTLRAVLTSMFHEGMPMVIYSQILVWGQSMCCVALVCLYSLLTNKSDSAMFSAMVPLGLEAGEDVMISQEYDSEWARTVVQESESLGLLAVTVIAIALFTAEPYLLSHGWMKSGSSDEHTSLMFPIKVGHAEAFERNHKGSGGEGGGEGGGGGALALPRSYSLGENIFDMKKHSIDPQDSYLLHSVGVSSSVLGGSSSSSVINRSPSFSALMTSGGVLNHQASSASSYSLDDRSAASGIGGGGSSGGSGGGGRAYASLGAHISLIALTVFVSFGFSLCFRGLEVYMDWTRNVFSGIRLFKLSMSCAFFVGLFIVKKSQIHFRRDWFMRLCGLMLDLLVISALCIANPRLESMNSVTHYLVCGVFVLVCIGWNAICFYFIARNLFPNFWFKRALTLSGDALGHSYMGLLFIRTLDPGMESPVPAAYAYKLMMFFIPSSGMKNTIVVSVVATRGPWLALVICACVVMTWYIIFDTHFKHRFVLGRKGAGGGGGKKSRSRSGDMDESSSGGVAMMSLTTPTEDSDETTGLVHALSYDLTEEEGEARGGDGGGGGGGGSLASYYTKESETTTSHTPKTPTRRQVSSANLQHHGGQTTATPSPPHHADLSSPPRRSSMSNPRPALSMSSDPSSIISDDQMRTIAKWLPDTRSHRRWHLKYSLRRDGASLETLLGLCVPRSRVDGSNSLVIVIEDSWGYVFGGFIAQDMENKAVRI